MYYTTLRKSIKKANQNMVMNGKIVAFDTNWSFEVNKSRYIALLVVSGTIKKLVSIDCVIIYFLNQ